MVVRLPTKLPSVPDFHKNVNELAEEAFHKYPEQFVAYSKDGRQIMANADTREELYARVKELEIPIDHVVIGFVDGGRHASMGPW